MSTFGQPPPNPQAMLVAEWVAKAEGDYAVARREAAVVGQQSFDAVGFHLQHAIEKIMKAVLVNRNVPVPRVHDLDVRDRPIGTVGVAPCASATDLAQLTAAAVCARYPGCTISATDARDLEKIAAAIWSKLRPLV